MSSPITVVSAPGKVLVAGGYLVLDRKYSGLVVATSSRFFCALRSSPSSQNLPHPTRPASSRTITIRAGQFPAEYSIWTYLVTTSLEGNGKIEVRAEGPKNKFVEIALRNALDVSLARISARGLYSSSSDAVTALFKAFGPDNTELDIVVLAHNDFYSQREALEALGLPKHISSLDSLPAFNPLPRPIQDTNKTGLGSSAALVTSLTAGILSHLGVVDLGGVSGTSSCSTDILLVHNLAQFSHCLAQGKVGSGFDVSSAVFGTHVYRRFSPSILSNLMAETPVNTASDPSFVLKELENDKWDHATYPFKLPKGLRLLLADVDAGTDTPSFVGQVLAWRKQDPEVASELWDDLGRANDALGGLLTSLAASDAEEGYAAVLDDFARMPVDQCAIGSPTAQLIARIRAALQTIRSYMQHMSKLSGVPIEPEKQTRLLDACVSLPGVIGGGVPGAGGYDAIYLLVVDHPSVLEGVERLWAQWEEMSLCPLSARQSDGGLQVEDVSKIDSLLVRALWK